MNDDRRPKCILRCRKDTDFVNFGILKKKKISAKCEDLVHSIFEVFMPPNPRIEEIKNDYDVKKNPFVLRNVVRALRVILTL